MCMAALKPHAMGPWGPHEELVLRLPALRGEGAGARAKGGPRLPQSLSLTISLVSLMPTAAEFHFPSGPLARPLREARWWGSGTVTEMKPLSPREQDVNRSQHLLRDPSAARGIPSVPGETGSGMAQGHLSIPREGPPEAKEELGGGGRGGQGEPS